MRQVNRDELVYVLQAALRKLTPAQIAAMRHWKPDERYNGRVMAAKLIADDLARLEILSDAPDGGTFPSVD